MKNTFALIAICLASTLLCGCQFMNKSNLLLPTAPSPSLASSTSSGSSSSSGSAASSSNGASASGASSAPAAAGTWASPALAGLPNLTSCSNLQWQISSQSTTAVTGTVSAVCGGVVNVAANLSGQMTGADVVSLSANGQAVGLGLTCVFSLNGTGHMQGNDAIKLDYTGTTCIGPVSGSETLHRRAPAAPAPPAPSAPDPQPQPEPDQPAFDDGAYGCSSIGDHMKLVECVHDHVQPHDEYQAFEVTKRVAWALRGEGAGLLIKTTGENIVPWRGYVFAAGRIAYPDGHIIKVISDVGAGGGNGPSWQDNGYVDSKLYVPALDTTY
jgi:hypothetical protein